MLSFPIPRADFSLQALTSIKSGAATMRPMPMSTTTLCSLVVGLTAPLLAQQGPCPQIIAACTSAGFTKGGASTGTGLQVDCIIPIMQGKAQPPAATRPLPQVDPQVVAACKANNPTLGQGKAPPSAAGKAPRTVSTTAPNANAATVAGPAQSQAGDGAPTFRLIVWTDGSPTDLVGLSGVTGPGGSALPTPAQVRAQPQARKAGPVVIQVRVGSPAGQRLSHMGRCDAPGCAIEIDRLGANAQVVQKYRFSDGTLVPKADTHELEEVSFTYGKITVSYIGGGSIDSSSWNVTGH